MTNWRLPVSSDEPIGQLSPQDWLDNTATQEVLEALTAEGAEVRFVGGCVRDAVVKRPVNDVDLATPDPPDKVVSLLEARGIKAIPTGLSHGTITAVHHGRSYEITTLRQDVETDGRHAKVAFTDSWRLDAARRDFTINTLSADGQGRIWDPFHGLEDLAAKRVRFVGDAETRIQEDVLRLLRFFRFNAHFGQGFPESIGLTACRKLAHRLTELSVERVASELLKLLSAADPSPIVTVMVADGILTPILPEIGYPDRLKLLVWLETKALIRPHIAPDVLRRFAALLPESGIFARDVCLRLHLSNAQTERIVAMALGWTNVTPHMTPREVTHLMQQAGVELFRDWVLLAWADQRRKGDQAKHKDTVLWTGLLDLADQFSPKLFPLKGQDLLNAGYAPGPALGALLNKAQEWWAEQDYLPDQKACLAYVKTL